MLNTWTWVAWLVCTLVLIWSTRNPIYLLTILLSLVLVWSVAESKNRKQYTDGMSALPFSPLRLSILIIFFSTIFNALISHFGANVVMHLPEWLPYLGGPVTLEALVYGAINGLVLSGILISFMVVNLSLPVRSLIRLIPQAFYPLAVVTTIAITFLPNTSRQLGQIKEAQAVRGHQVRGVKDWLPLIMPLLIGGLERAMDLAETMTARGFASGKSVMKTTPGRMGIIAGLAALLFGWLLQWVDIDPAAGMVLVGLGAGLILFSVWLQGMRFKRSIFRRESWTYMDLLVIAVSIVSVSLFLLPLNGLDRSSLAYNPYPELTTPDFSPIFALACISVAFPAVMTNISKNDFDQ